MKCLERNKSKFYYALYQSKSEITDDYGNKTGEYEITYGDPNEYRGNVSVAKGETESMQFGENLSYDKVLVLDKEAPGIDEYSVLWIDTMPQFVENSGELATDSEGEIITPHDYIVKKVAKSLNHVAIAISKVTVND